MARFRWNVFAVYGVCHDEPPEGMLCVIIDIPVKANTLGDVARGPGRRGHGSTEAGVKTSHIVLKVIGPLPEPLALDLAIVNG